MGLFDSFFKGKVSLTQQNRDLIYKLFGSFGVNQLGTSDSASLSEGYEANVDVYSVIKKITETYKAVPTIVERNVGGEWELFENSTIDELMANPNPGKGYTWDDIEEMIATYLLATGNSYLVGQDGLTTRIDEVDVLPSNSIDIVSNNDYFMPNLKYQFKLNSQVRNFEQEELEHIRLFNPLFNSVEESFKGLSPIQVASRVVKVGNDRWDADANLLQNRGAIGLITDKSNRPMTPEEANRVQSSFDADTGGTHNYGKVKVTNKDLSYIQMAMSSADLQLIEKGVINLRAICSVYSVDSSLFNDPANQTYNNRKEAEKALYTNAIIPMAEKISQKHTTFIAKNHYPMGDVRMRKDFSSVEALQTDKKQEAEKDKIVMDGVNTILSMPISSEAKAELLKDTYDFTDEMASLISTPNEIENNL
jgi:HK97 family phage portal protein